MEMDLRILIILVILVAAAIFAVNGEAPRDSFAKIHDIQGDAQLSPLNGQTVSIEAVVTGDFEGKAKLNGFFVQEEDGEADSLAETSEGIFVYDPRNMGKKENISTGDLVKVTGQVIEYNNLTEINLIQVQRANDAEKSLQVTAVQIILPVEDEQSLEQYEGMLVEFPQELTVTNNYNFANFGEKMLSTNGRLPNPTNIVEPGAPAKSIQSLNKRSQILLDDGSKLSYPSLDPFPKTLRSGDSIQGIKGILSYDYGDYRIEPLNISKITISNPRPERPDEVEGRIKVASFNVENYFNGDGMGGGFETSLGARSQEAFNRQRTKIIAAITGMNADVIGLMELENDGYGELSAIRDLVNGLYGFGENENSNYSIIDPGWQKLGTDNITVGLIYNSSKLKPVGQAMTISTGAFSANNRQPLAQTFEELSTGDKFTVVASHLKSKRSPGKTVGLENMDNGDGQGYWNGARTNAAKELVTWIASDPTQSNDPDYIILGDMNSYNYEDPIQVFKNASYVDLVATYNGPDAYSYGFEGQWGNLDHILASQSLAGQIAGATVWHINADESGVFGYDGKWYGPDKFRCSDHDPVIAGLDLSSNSSAS